MKKVGDKFLVGGLTLDLPIIVGAGVCKAPEQVLPYQDAPVGVVVAGSFTPSPREKNGGTNMWPEEASDERDLAYVINSWGMPNCGYGDAISRFVAIGHKLTNPLVVSIAGFSPEDFERGVREFGACAAAIELNFGCPNTIEHGGGITMSYDLRGITQTLRRLETGNIHKVPLWLKFSPFHHSAHLHLLEEIAALIDASRFTGANICAVTSVNTLPGVSIKYGNDPLITAGGGYGGLSGKMLKPIALENVRCWRRALPKEIDVIGMGGATNGGDVVDFLEEGVAAVGLTSLPYYFGPRGMEDLVARSYELQDYLS